MTIHIETKEQLQTLSQELDTWERFEYQLVEIRKQITTQRERLNSLTLNEHAILDKQRQAAREFTVLTRELAEQYRRAPTTPPEETSTPNA